MTNTVRVDGWPVAPGAASAFLNRLKPAFERQFPGVTLHVYSGYRSYEDQVKIFMDRYDPYPAPYKGPFNDVRVWQGVRYVRMRGEGTVAQPGTSNHMSGAALDIRDSGADAGVSSRTPNPRATWIKKHAAEYGFTPIGYTFSEPWHIEYTGAPWEGGTAAGSGGGSSAENEGDEEVTEDDIQKIARAVWNYQIGEAGKKGVKNKPAWQRLGLAQHAAEWVMDRIAGSASGTTITDMLRAIIAKK